MSKINNYEEFINEGFFKKVFGRKNKNKSTVKSRIDLCVDEIVKFLSDNNIYTWDKFVSSTKFERDTVNKLIDNSTMNMKELEEIRFRIKLELSNRKQLLDYIKELEQNEEYEKCARIVKKISE
jgi:hypothetical protein